jgi:dTDP-glucose 4,6-dehydratase
MNALHRDLEEIVERNADDFAELRGMRLFVTGGTGFVGTWLLESFVHANARLALGARAVVLTRDPVASARRSPRFNDEPALTFVRGDVRDFPPVDGSFDAIVHAATPASSKVNDESPLTMIEIIVDGTRRVLELAGRNAGIPLLLTSSGAVYGRQPPEMPLVDESYAGGPDPLDPRNAYHEGKRLSELLCSVANEAATIRAKIARLFAFVGPYLPLDRHFAIGNFVSDALAGRAIEILGDGTPVRTYQYAGDMTSWLWRILIRGAPSRAYNVGSERPISIEQTAAAVAIAAGKPGEYVVRGIPNPGALPARYACSTSRARSELDLADWTPLEEALRRTIAWHRALEGMPGPT